jgi:hypothetical protein
MRPRHFKVCPTCGFPLADHELSWLFRGKHREIFEYVAAAGTLGISIHQLVDKVYSDHPDGGPLYARNCVAVMVRQRINPKLEPYGLKITAGRGRDSRPYRLVPLRASGYDYARERI